MPPLAYILYAALPLLGLGIFLAVVSGEHRRIALTLEGEQALRERQEARRQKVEAERAKKDKAESEMREFMNRITPNGRPDGPAGST